MAFRQIKEKSKNMRNMLFLVPLHSVDVQCLFLLGSNNGTLDKTKDLIAIFFSSINNRPI